MSYILLFDFSLTMSDFDEHGWVNPGLATLFLISLYMNFSLDVVFFWLYVWFIPSTLVFYVEATRRVRTFIYY